MNLIIQHNEQDLKSCSHDLFNPPLFDREVGRMDFDFSTAADSIQNSSLYFSGYHKNDEAYRSFHPTDAIAA